MLRTMVIGVGHLGRHHARIVRESSAAELVAVVDTDLERGREVAAGLGVPAVAHPDQVESPVDAAVIAAPTGAHAALAAPLLERGLALLVEKPLAGDVASASRLVALAEERGAVLQVGHVERFNPAVMAVLAMGIRPAYIEARRISPFTLRSAAVGVVVDLMIHDLDIVTHLVGEPPVRTEALGVGVITGKEDMASARLTFASGAVADLSASRLALKTERRVRVFSTDAYVSLDYVARKGVVYRVDPRLRLSDFGASALDALRASPAFTDLFQQGLLRMTPLEMGDHEPLSKQFESFVRAARREAPPVVDGRDGLEAIRTAVDIQEKVRAFAERFAR
ncbi:MAG: Gfo/Idh/MocA family oxidoreductase [Planctomycetes bacterium]|nr:Gfo/Idh/MocA family oxidoreductase [Planctomycetota bacterium]